ncbi:hypothetical protein B0H10DRAFT_1996051 [Mycena sp. CBHHK59/15]|nr:hypothetical protein B0H10DRAFT_1996051 [Mycena sp. CBHHK59/15]
MPDKPSPDIARNTSLAVSSPRPCTPIKPCSDGPPNTPPAPFTSRPCTPFQPLPPVLVTSPLRLPSFLDITLQSLDCEPTAPSLKSSESPSPQPIFNQLSIEIPSVSHPNSPYVPWAGARAPEPQEPGLLPTQTRFLKLSKSFKNLRRTVKQGVKHVKNALKKFETSRPSPSPTIDPEISFPLQSPSFPSPTASCESSETTTLAVWLRQCEMNVERATPHFMTLEEYEERGSWMDMSSVRDEFEIHSCLVAETGGDDMSDFGPSSIPMSPTCASSHSFPQLMHDIWPTPPRHATATPIFSTKRDREMSMPGGWSFGGLKDSPLQRT